MHRRRLPDYYGGVHIAMLCPAIVQRLGASIPDNGHILNQGHYVNSGHYQPKCLIQQACASNQGWFLAARALA